MSSPVVTLQSFVGVLFEPDDIVEYRLIDPNGDQSIKQQPEYQRTSAAFSSGYVIALTFVQVSRSMAKRLLSWLRRLSR